jgi:hypothetical protein
MMTRKRYMQCLPLVAAMVALMAASAFAVAPIIDELPRVVIAAPGNSIANAVNLDAYINWFPITATEPWGANRDYPGHASKNAAYTSSNRFHVFVYDGTRPALTNAVTAPDDVNLLSATNAHPYTALPANAAADRYKVDPYNTTAPVKLGLTYTSVPPAQTAANIDVFAVVEGNVNGNQIVAGYAPMLVTTGATGNQVGYSIQLISGRAADSFFYWIPRLYATVAGQFSPVPPRGRDLVTTTWADHALRNQNSIIGWVTTGFLPTGNALGIGVFDAAARGATAAYGDFIPNGGGGTTSPVFQVKARLVSSSPTAAGTPGFRVGFLNGGQTHSGTLQVVGEPNNVPYGYVGTGPGQRQAGHDFIGRTYWTTPLNLIDMGPTGRIAPFAAGIVLDPDATDPVYIAADGRDYGVEIMCIVQTTSLGEFDVDSLSVITIADGDLTTTGTAKEWGGTTGLALNATNWPISYFGGAITNGYGTFESNVMLLWGARDARTNHAANNSTAGSFRLVKTAPPALGLAAASNTLYRTTYLVTSGGIYSDGNAQFSPCIEAHYSMYNGSNGQTTGGKIDWYESWGPQANYLKDPTKNRPTGALTPGVPAGGTTASAIKSYVWTHTVPSGYSVLPEIYVYNTGVWNNVPAGVTSPWGDADGFYKFTDIKMERIANVH